MQQCIKRSNILKRKSDISSLFKKGSFFKSRSFTLRYYKNNLELNRFAVLVSRKHGSAVERNKIKRVYREVVKENFNIDSSFFLDLVLRPKIGIAADYNIIKNEFSEWLQVLEKQL